MWKIFDILFPLRTDAAALRSLSSDEFLALAAPQLLTATSPATVALLPFPEPAVRAAIHEAKYHGSVRAFTLLAQTLAEYLLEADDMAHRPIVVPVPLGKKRRKERGFNQIEEVLRQATKECSIEINTALLVRTRETLSQVSLPRYRRKENMRGAFRATHEADPARTYILIDDVITTGATLQSAVDALIEAGAKHIVPLALAH